MTKDLVSNQKPITTVHETRPWGFFWMQLRVLHASKCVGTPLDVVALKHGASSQLGAFWMSGPINAKPRNRNVL